MSQPTQSIVIWDWFIRLFHWSVVLLFTLNFWVLEEGDPPHEWVGYILGGLLVLRIVWGFIGSENARFSSFFPTPQRVRKHLNDLKIKSVNPEEGHNPLGGAMVLMLLLCLSLITVSGWLLTWDMFWGEEWLEEIHELFANLTLFFVCIHVFAVVVMTKLTGIPLLKTMLTGKRSV